MDNLTRSLAYLGKLPRAVEGSHGHKAMFEAVRATVKFGLNDSQAWEALTWFNTNRCDPPFTERELKHKLAARTKVSHASPVANSGPSRRQSPRPVGKLKPLRIAREVSPPASTAPANDSAYAQHYAQVRELALVELARRSEAAYSAALDALCFAANPETIAAYALAAAHAHIEFYGDDGADLGGEGWRAWAREQMAEFSEAELLAELEDRAVEAMAFADGADC